jgi:hypothetical protein
MAARRDDRTTLQAASSARPGRCIAARPRCAHRRSIDRSFEAKPHRELEPGCGDMRRGRPLAIGGRTDAVSAGAGTRVVDNRQTRVTSARNARTSIAGVTARLRMQEITVVGSWLQSHSEREPCASRHRDRLVTTVTRRRTRQPFDIEIRRRACLRCRPGHCATVERGRETEHRRPHAATPVRALSTMSFAIYEMTTCLAICRSGRFNIPGTQSTDQELVVRS